MIEKNRLAIQMWDDFEYTTTDRMIKMSENLGKVVDKSILAYQDRLLEKGAKMIDLTLTAKQRGKMYK
jgi:hypothetical protein